ncbi:hypothetical protein ACOSP7_015591 [Xanthoceras sorbifolium]
MELQLGLSLPTHAVKLRFDLNSYVYDHKDIMCSHSSRNALDFVFLPTNCTSTTNNDICSDAKKRSFDEAFEQVRPVPPTLPLLRWTNQPNDDDDPKDFDNSSSFSTNKISEEDDVVGWPPIKNLRKKHRHQHHRSRAGKNNQTVENGFGCGDRQSNSIFVKVNMEGVAITRKIDLSLHDSFQTLTNTLMAKFGSWHHEDSKSYKLSYQDKEGDWLLAQDVPWRTFIRTVQRLKLLKSSSDS